MKPETTWQNKRKVIVGGSGSLGEVKEKCAGSLRGELAGWRVDKKACPPSSNF